MAGPRLATVARGDPLTPYLDAALAARYPVVASVDVELTGLPRAVVGALTIRPGMEAWSQRYMKSGLGFQLRSRAAGRGLAAAAGPVDVVVQTHALFRTPGARTVVYVDCTFRQAERGWPAWTPLHGRARARWLRHETALYRDAAHLFAFTDAARASIVDDYGVAAERVTTVGAGVNFDAAPVPRAPATDPTVLFVGKEFERKGGDVVLAAFEQVRTAVPDARLQIVGCVPPRPLPAGVDVLGRVDDRARMAALYARASVFCLASRFDPAPLVVLEAMSLGLPCVLTRGAAAHVDPVLADGGGVLTENGDAAGLAHGLTTYLQQPDLARRAGGIAQQAMTQRYRWADVVERMAPAIERVAHDGGAGGVAGARRGR